MKLAPAPAPDAPLAPPPRTADLFLGFLGLGLIGFGGVLPLTRRMMVERRHWLSEAEFAELLGLCQFLPGGNIINLSVAVGLKFRGVGGAVASLLGLIAAPSAIVIALGVIYARFEDEPVLHHLFAGLAAAAAGLLLATALKMIGPLWGKLVSLGVAAFCFVVIALIRVPLLPAMLVLAPLSVLATWRFGE